MSDDLAEPDAMDAALAHERRVCSFTLSTDRTIKMIGLGMAAAVLVDALIVRTVLVPAIMHTLGRRNWYLPSWLDRRLPHLEIEEEPSPRGNEHELALARSDERSERAA